MPCYKFFNFALEVKIWTKNLQKRCFTLPSGLWQSITFSQVEIKNCKAKQKKVSASTNMAQIFTGGRSFFFFFFFLLKTIYTQIRYANLNFSRAGKSWTPVASLPEERRCHAQSWPGRACVLDGWPRRVTRGRCLKPLRLELRLIVHDDVKKDMALV